MTEPIRNGAAAAQTSGGVLGHLDLDEPGATNESVTLRATAWNRPRVRRGRFVRIIEARGGRTRFLGRIVAGPFSPCEAPHEVGPIDGCDDVFARIEVEGEIVGERVIDTNTRPSPGSAVVELTADEVRDLIGCTGDMLLGTLSGDALPVCLRGDSKDVLPRNVGIFGTVGSGKSNTAQVLIEEAAAAGWAVVVLDVEGEYVGMDAASDLPAPGLAARPPEGLADFRVLHPASCASFRPDSRPFTLRLADFETPIVAELIRATRSERNALTDCVDHFESRSRTKAPTSDMDRLLGLLDPSPQAQLPFTLQGLYDRARERSPRSTEVFDYVGLAAKLMWLIHAGAFDQGHLKALDPAELLVPGRVTVIDASIANDTVKNLVTADLLRKAFAYKVAREDAPRTLVVVEEAHSFVSKEKAQSMQATLQMLRDVTRRGRKRWLSMAFVSQQPGHLPPEIFELCNTRVVHTLRSMHNLEALMATTSDITRELWARCPLLGTGEAILSSPQLKRPVTLTVRPARTRRKFTR